MSEGRSPGPSGSLSPDTTPVYLPRAGLRREALPEARLLLSGGSPVPPPALGRRWSRQQTGLLVDCCATTAPSRLEQTLCSSSSTFPFQSTPEFPLPSSSLHGLWHRQWDLGMELLSLSRGPVLGFRKGHSVGQTPVRGEEGWLGTERGPPHVPSVHQSTSRRRLGQARFPRSSISFCKTILPLPSPCSHIPFVLPQGGTEELDEGSLCTLLTARGPSKASTLLWAPLA